MPQRAAEEKSGNATYPVTLGHGFLVCFCDYRNQSVLVAVGVSAVPIHNLADICFFSVLPLSQQRRLSGPSRWRAGGLCGIRVRQSALFVCLGCDEPVTLLGEIPAGVEQRQAITTRVG